MVSNYSYDPKNLSSVRNSATPHEGPSGTEPEFSLPAQLPAQSAPQQVSTPFGQSSLSSAGQPSAATDETVGVHRRLTPGIELSDGKRYLIEKMIASGGMGAVYRATDKRFNKPCAVKEMLDDFQTESERVQAVEWFSREASLLLELNHQCIPRVRDFFVDGGRHYLVMDFIEGRTMADILEREGNVVGRNDARGVSEARARHWAQQVCSVLAHLHRQNPPIIFRDLKPSNIMVTTMDEVKLIDFGIARTFQTQGQATIIMTPGYAPQEQLLGSPEPRSDIYALGATLYRVLTHHDASNNQPTIFSFPPLRALRPDVSPAFEQIVMKALALMPQDRWPGAAAMERVIINLPPITVVPPEGPIIRQPGQPLTPPTPSGPQTPNGLNRAAGASMPSSGPRAQLGVNGPAGAQIVAATNQITAGRIDEAYITVQRAYGIEPNNALVHKLFGQVFARRQQAELATQAYTKSLQLNSEDAETHKLIGDVWLFLRQQPHQAIPAYTQSLRLNTRDYEVHQRLAQSYEKTNQLELALREYQEAVRLAPRQGSMLAPLHFALGQLAMRLNQFPLAEQSFVQVLMINPGDHQTRFLLSQAYERQNKLEDAFRECKYVLGPLGQINPAVQPMFNRLRAQLGR